MGLRNSLEIFGKKQLFLPVSIQVPIPDAGFRTSQKTVLRKRCSSYCIRGEREAGRPQQSPQAFLDFPLLVLKLALRLLRKVFRSPLWREKINQNFKSEENKYT